MQYATKYSLLCRLLLQQAVWHRLAKFQEIMMTQKKQSEMAVITKAKELCSYVMVVTQKSPKHFRFTFVTRMHNLALDVIENLYRANDTFVTGKDLEARRTRLEFQHKAITSRKLLAYISYLAYEQGCILPKQYEQISVLATGCRTLAGAWISSDRKRFPS